ncbi:uncharacterized protein LOC142398347 [Odontesthes bonariensis]|uniref:uncharacterized protein LOC142398347 n=1 Tax=Odontesthes bonariensis TaxID=219752 RepID=UPI003F586443
MSQQPVALNTSGGVQLLNLTQLVFDHRRLLQLYRRKEEEEAFFVDYIPPARDAITLPRSVVYVLVGVVLIIVATYAIVGHLIKDLMHDLAVFFIFTLWFVYSGQPLQRCDCQFIKTGSLAPNQWKRIQREGVRK